MTDAPKSPGLLAILVYYLPAYAVGRLRVRLFGYSSPGCRALETNFLCNDCGLDVVAAAENYMVLDDVWTSAGLGIYEGLLCIGCLEDRLGRTLTPGDFLACPLNANPARWQSPRLLDRMGDTAWMIPEIEALHGRHWAR